MIDLSYNNLLQLIQPYKVDGRTESAAFLHWFLINIYRLEKLDVDNIVCDGRGDKGIDGIYIDDNEEYIDVLQSKIVQRNAKTLGDTQLKEFLGTLLQLETKEGIDNIISTTGNSQLKNLLIDGKDKISSPDYSIRGIFVTNATKDNNANELLANIPDSSKLVVWDKAEISRMYVPGDKDIFPTAELTFDCFSNGYLKYNVNNVASVVIASVSATDIVQMEGIQNQQVFDFNLRKGLGKTKVNKDIYESIEDQSEHQNFLLYHNGITIVCNHLDTSREDQIKIKDYTVVNGCQSVSCLYDKREEITQDLKILTRIVEVKPDSELIAQITYNSNNQNGIKVRDFRSNTATQVRLQKEINQDYSDYFYQIKTGERIPDNRIGIDNQLAGRILLVFDLKEPWAVQGIVKMFEDSHSRIFARPEVTGGRIVTLFKLYQKTNEALEQVKPELFRSYQITGFMLLYLVSKVLSEDEVGRDFCANPVKFCQTPEHEQSLFESIEIILSDLTEDLSFEFEERGGENFDFKKTYKSPNMLRELATEVIQSYKKLVKRGKAESFSELWKEKMNS